MKGGDQQDTGGSSAYSFAETDYQREYGEDDADCHHKTGMDGLKAEYGVLIRYIRDLKKRG